MLRFPSLSSFVLNQNPLGIYNSLKQSEIELSCLINKF